MKGSAITGPVGKEAAELWPVSDLIQNPSYLHIFNSGDTAYCQQLRCCDVKEERFGRANTHWGEADLDYLPTYFIDDKVTTMEIHRHGQPLSRQTKEEE